MILPGTLRRLKEKSALIYGVSFPAVTVSGMDIPGYTEYFATQKQAQAVLLRHEPFVYGAIFDCGAKEIEWDTMVFHAK